MRNLEEFNDAYVNRTCFILGAGPSLLGQDLSPLRRFVTIAVNSGYVALPESDFCLSDDWASARWSYFFDDLRSSKKTVALLYETKLADKAPIFGNRAVLLRHRKGYELTKPYSHSDQSKHIWEARTSVGSAIHVAHIMGCQKVILLGTDCCRVRGRRYFWQFKEWPNKPYRNDHVGIDSYTRCHIGNKQSDRDLKSIFVYWNMISKNLLKTSIKVYNASPISLLKSFPKITLQEAVESGIEKG